MRNTSDARHKVDQEIINKYDTLSKELSKDEFAFFMAGVATGLMDNKNPNLVYQSPSASVDLDDSTLDIPANASENISPVEEKVVVKTGLDGIWRQHINGKAGSEFSVRFNNENREYEMSLVEAVSRGATSKGGTNIQYDGETWSFDSDGGYRIGKFVLKKVDDNTFEGTASGNQRNRWVRINVPTQTTDAAIPELQRVIPPPRQSQIPPQRPPQPVVPQTRSVVPQGNTRPGERIERAADIYNRVRGIANRFGAGI